MLYFTNKYVIIHISNCFIREILIKQYVNITKKLSVLKELRPFSPMLEQLIQDQLMLKWIYNSNAIEGNTLTYKETSFYLLRGLTAKGKSLEELTGFKSFDGRYAIEM